MPATSPARHYRRYIDPEILELAARRLGRRCRLICGDFQQVTLPASDAVAASFALHHVRTLRAKATLYRHIRAALGRGGVCVMVDCHPAGDAALAREQRRAWMSHLETFYSRTESTRFLKAWAREDVYVPLEEELELMERSGFGVEVLWRKGAFAVLRASSPLPTHRT